MNLQEALDRLTGEPRDATAGRVLAEAVHTLAGHMARDMRLDAATGEQEAQELLLRVLSAAHAGTLRVTHAEAWLRRSLRNRLVSVVRAPKAEGLDAELLDRVPVETAPGSNPVARLRAAYAAALEARAPVNRPGLEEAWRRYWRTVDESRTLEAIVREEDPDANVGSAQRAHDRMAKAVCAAAEPDDRARFEKLLSLRVLSGGAGEPRPGDGDP